MSIADAQYFQVLPFYSNRCDRKAPHRIPLLYLRVLILELAYVLYFLKREEMGVGW